MGYVLITNDDGREVDLGAFLAERQRERALSALEVDYSAIRTTDEVRQDARTSVVHFLNDLTLQSEEWDRLDDGR